jgi:hypothetical protein
MDNPIVVFLGPTLQLEQARSLLDAVYVPPAEQGHIVDIVQRVRPRAIILIDGAFASVPAVRHKEIMWALSQGVEILGASSLGALRAAELADVGMKGYGLIYRWYRATLLADDDEVAVAMAPPELGAYPLGDALIDMRITLRRAQRDGIISEILRRVLVSSARTFHFLERSYAGVLARARVGAPAHWKASLTALEAWIHNHSVSQKQIDAIGLLQWVRGRGGKAASRPNHVPPFRMTEAFAYDIDAAGIDTQIVLGVQKR